MSRGDIKYEKVTLFATVSTLSWDKTHIACSYTYSLSLYLCRNRTMRGVCGAHLEKFVGRPAERERERESFFLSRGGGVMWYGVIRAPLPPTLKRIDRKNTKERRKDLKRQKQTGNFDLFMRTITTI